MIDYIELCHRFCSTEPDPVDLFAKLNTKSDTDSSNEQKTSFALSGWLQQGSTTDTVDCVTAENESQADDLFSSARSRPMGDLHVKSVRLYPPELELGEWPESYSLSDHGLVEVDFLGEITRKNS